MGNEGRWLRMALVVGALAGSAGCGPGPATSRAEPAGPAERVVVTAIGQRPQDERFVGVIAPRERVELSSPIAARLGRVHVRLGEEVVAGQLLAELDTAELDADLKAAEGALREAQAEAGTAHASHQQALAEARQLRRLLRGGMVSEREASTAEFDVTRARAARARAQALVDQRRALLAKLRQVRARTELRAPMAGRVIARGFDAGALVPPTVAIVTIGSGAHEVRFAVPPARAAELTVGRSVVVEVGDLRLDATVSARAADVDTAMGLVVVVATPTPSDASALPPMGTRVDVGLAPPRVNF